MDQFTVQLLTTTAGLVATLVAVWITQASNRRGEINRRKHEAATRWHDENYRACKTIISEAIAIEDKLQEAVLLLDDEIREDRMPVLTVFLSPPEGFEGLFDDDGREELIEALERGYRGMDEIDGLAVELSIIGSVEQAKTAQILSERVLDAAGAVETFSRYSDAQKYVYAIRHARQAFEAASRDYLLSTGTQLRGWGGDRKAPTDPAR